MRKKKLILIIALVSIVILAAAPVFASLSGNPLCRDPQYCIDDDQLMTLNEKLEDISEKQGCEVCIYVTDTLDGKTPTEYADDYFDYFNYGYGYERNGILLLVDLDSRQWAISTTGFGITAFTDAGQEYIMDKVLPYLSDENYNEAFNVYADLCDEFLTQAYTGEPYDTDNLPEEEKDVSLPLDIGVGGILGALASFFVVGQDKSELKTVRRKSEAKNYMRNGSLSLTGQYEHFLYSNIEQIEKKKSSGSSTHVGSSGTTHGGSSGSF